MKVFLLRHGETPTNRDHLALGRSNPPLSDFGEHQARAAGRSLAEIAVSTPIAAIYSSPLQRALQTATIAAEELGIAPPTVVDDLTEMDIGIADGLTMAELRERHADFMSEWRSERGADAVLPGGESLSEVQRRIWPAIEQLRDLHAESNIVCVSHYFALHTVICAAIGLPLAEWRRFEVNLASISAIDFRANGRTILSQTNETCHLTGLDVAATLS